MEFLEGNMCRLCLAKKDLLDLFISSSADSLCDMLISCTTIKLNKDDGLPPYICVSCTQKLELSYDFIKQSEKSNKILQTEYIQNSYGELEPYEMPTDLDYEDVMASCEVKLDCEDTPIDSKGTITQFIDKNNRIYFERASDLKNKIGNFLDSNKKSPILKKDLVHKTVDYIKSNTNLVIKKVNVPQKKAFKKIKKEIDDLEESSKDDDSDYDVKIDTNNCDNEENDEDDEEYVPVKVAKVNKGIRLKNKYKNMKVRRHMIAMKNRPKFEKISRGLESRFKLTPKIIQLSKYKNCTSSNKGPYKGINERMIKVYRPKHSMREGPCKRGRKPVLDRDEAGRIIRPKHQCYVCGLMTADIKQHMTSHTGEKSHACEVCDRRFSTRGNLIHHKKIHSGVKSHVCQVCGAAFIYASCLQRHLDIHTGTKPHKCHLCDKAFQLAQGLKRHLTVHEGARPHACHMCPARFNQPHQLKTHIRSHTGEKPYVCGECGEAFTYKYVLNNHVKKHAAMSGNSGNPVVNININNSNTNGQVNVMSMGQTQQMNIGNSLSALHSVQHMMPDMISNANLVSQQISVGQQNQNLVGLVLGPPVCSQ